MTPQKADFPSRAALITAADVLGVDEATIETMAEVEAGPYGAFLDSGEPVCLWERHIFHRLTSGRFDGARAEGLPERYSLISSRIRGGYGPVSAQHLKLQAGVKLNREAALKSVSLGLYQILGLNHKAAGFETVQGFVTAMYRSVDDHLAALVNFVLADPRLVRALRARDWPMVARIYNGPAYASHGYDTRFAAVYDRLRAQTGDQRA